MINKIVRYFIYNFDPWFYKLLKEVFFIYHASLNIIGSAYMLSHLPVKNELHACPCGLNELDIIKHFNKF